MKLRALVIAASLLAAPAFAADLKVPAKAPLFGAYPTTRCGMYYGVGTGGSATAMNGSVVGAQVVQGELDALVGYACPLGAAGFWFVEGSVGFDNINGSVNGLAMSGPLVLIQRAGAGSPINTWFNPFGNQLSLPALPALPSGVTAGPANGYFFAGAVEQDVSFQTGFDRHNKVWLAAPIVGVGLLSRFSDGVVVDTWAGYQLNSQSFCVGGGAFGCGKMGNGGRVGVSFKY
jgi:hypothetical protein